MLPQWEGNSEEAVYLKGDEGNNEHLYCIVKKVLLLKKNYLQSKSMLLLGQNVRSIKKFLKWPIDSGNNEDNVSCKLVKQLKLTCVPHPFPYTVSWTKKGS